MAVKKAYVEYADGVDEVAERLEKMVDAAKKLMQDLLQREKALIDNV
ncbi:MAG: hypothetical protein PUK75_03340 [bacterium]|nr:hypothetical protein [bacterium]MDY4101012.1 hypothetical protein [Lachnospiraceae bacterium]